VLVVSAVDDEAGHRETLALVPLAGGAPLILAPPAEPLGEGGERRACALALAWWRDLAAAEGMDADDRLWLIRLMAGRDWIWIEGNHDPGPVDLGVGGRAEVGVTSAAVDIDDAAPALGAVAEALVAAYPQAAVVSLDAPTPLPSEAVRGYQWFDEADPVAGVAAAANRAVRGRSDRMDTMWGRAPSPPSGAATL
jgi:hypothetical protein